jgi:hypothetical protein
VNGVLGALTTLTEALTQANIAAPVVFGLISGIAATFRAITKDGPTATEVADMLEAKLSANAAYGKAEIERLKSL